MKEQVEYLMAHNEKLKEEIHKLRTQINKYKYDSMTGLLGRSDFNDRLAEFDHFYQVNKKDYSLVIVDVDGLHATNRDYGYNAGDRLIKQVALDLVKLFPEDFCARIGGDEFAVLSRNVDTFSIKEKLMTLQNASSGVDIASSYDNHDELFDAVDNTIILHKSRRKTDR